MTPCSSAGPTREAGFTLVEIVIVIMVIGILASLVIPKYRQSELKAQGADVLGRIEAINVAIKGYEADHEVVEPFTGPVGQPPDWLTTYLRANYFSGPAAITMQLARTDLTSPCMLILVANGSAEQEILISVAAALGDRAAMVGQGQSVTVTMAD